MGRKLSRRAYAELFGPTTGDRIRLGDSDLWAEVERDLLVPGDESVFGGVRANASPRSNGRPSKNDSERGGHREMRSQVPSS